MTDSGGAPTAPSTDPAHCPILVVDDDAELVASLGRALRTAGYPVTTHTSPALALHGSRVEGLTVLVSDLEMPGMDGIELSRQMLAEDPDLAVIILTGAATAESAAASIELGLIEYLQKPLGIDLLVEAVGRAIRERARNIFRRQHAAWERRNLS